MQWSGATPPQWREDMAVPAVQLSTDAPVDDLHHGPEHHDADRVAARDAAFRTRGIRRAVTAARAADGRPVACTAFHRTATVTWYANQGTTVLAPQHRGRRLGLPVKLANLDRVRAEHPTSR